MRSAGALSCAFRSVSAIVCRTAVGRRTVAVSVGPPAAPAAQRDTASALLSTADAASGHGLTGPVRQLIRVDRFSPPADQGSENHPPAASAPYADPPADWRLQPDSRSIYRTSGAAAASGAGRSSLITPRAAPRRHGERTQELRTATTTATATTQRQHRDENLLEGISTST
jgi:hypothetical protein